MNRLTAKLILTSSTGQHPDVTSSPQDGGRLGEVWTAILFFGILIVNYLVWFHLWPFVVKLLNARRLQHPIREEREASVAVYGFFTTFIVLGVCTFLFWLLGGVG